jgi:hypothetical protein
VLGRRPVPQRRGACAARARDARRAPLPTSRAAKYRALAGLLARARANPFVVGKELFATLTAGLGHFGEGDDPPWMFCLKEPPAGGVGAAPQGQTTYTHAHFLERLAAAAAAAGEPVPVLQPVGPKDWAAQPLGAHPQRHQQRHPKSRSHSE